MIRPQDELPRFMRVVLATERHRIERQAAGEVGGECDPRRCPTRFRDSEQRALYGSLDLGSLNLEAQRCGQRKAQGVDR